MILSCNFGDKLLFRTYSRGREYYFPVIYLRQEEKKIAVVHENSKVVMLVSINDLFKLADEVEKYEIELKQD